MKKIVIATDSFKGSISSEEACKIIEKAALDVDPALQTVTVPVADGGEGSVEALGAKKHFCMVNDAFFQSVSAFWGEIGESAVIELAAAAGLPMAKHPDPSVTTTYGVGELIFDALSLGKRKFILALGGSSTNDMGCGMASALGAKFYDGEGKSFIPVGGTLSQLASVDLSGMDARLSECEFITMCDVTNPLCGPSGASYVFAPQKGATPEMLPLLDEGMKNAARIIEKAIGKSVSQLPGAGAAGGCGAGSVAFFNSKLQSGIKTVLALKDFSHLISNADLVISGEGRFDSQSVDGKVVSGIAEKCLEKKVPLIVLCGAYLLEGTRMPEGVKAVFSILHKPCSLEEALTSGKENLYQASTQLFRLLLK